MKSMVPRDRPSPLPATESRKAGGEWSRNVTLTLSPLHSPRAVEKGTFHLFHFFTFGAADRALARIWIEERGGRQCRMSWLKA